MKMTAAKSVAPPFVFDRDVLCSVVGSPLMRSEAATAGAKALDELTTASSSRRPVKDKTRRSTVVEPTMGHDELVAQAALSRRVRIVCGR